MGAAVEDGKSTPGQSEGMIVRPDLHQSTLSVLVRQPEWSGADAFHSTLDPFAVMAAAGRHPPPGTAAIGSNVFDAPWSPDSDRIADSDRSDQRWTAVAGFGTGGSPEEYRAVGVPMSERGGTVALTGVRTGSTAATPPIR